MSATLGDYFICQYFCIQHNFFSAFANVVQKEVLLQEHPMITTQATQPLRHYT